ncbi:bifunctional ADP-dependent NAD(P)H-hydrate dehydratase/NAD(P)H-hydrate epimerase [Dyadobacter tibetensis]|uniref:bifunctional ADP-dependent NAD(P)H-hydrate dehydratase/NAD(P)H-hydrate epimerase n=1 Tax=Dyadobacter tibetensis TaxID=1211851 RepID=UPI000470D253|nr:bifunctional ADP-dependent NAD(P)H-hydrate dehydratase/NAD(P)H-hydrate epimerase [Dyadobacter tibetensis]
MKILNSTQIRQADAATIAHEQISSLQLMERASAAFVHWFCNQFVNTRPVAIFCGQGNNGGDGLAIARQLSQLSYSVRVFMVQHTSNPSSDYLLNLDRLRPHVTPEAIHQEADFPELSENYVLIDALLGSGLSRPATDLMGKVIDAINLLSNKTVSVDIASGLFMDQLHDASGHIIEPDFTVSFQIPKLAFMFSENSVYTGQWQVVDIGLNNRFMESCPSSYYLTDHEVITSISKPRARFSHKGTFGHALLVAGSYGKMGAAVLASRACLRSGVGLLTVHIPRCGYDIMQISTPEAMTSTDFRRQFISQVPDIAPYSAIGIGPGLGQDPATLKMIEEIFSKESKPFVIDADALNLMAQNRYLLDRIPENSILTPHPKEFDRLAGPARNSQHRLKLAIQFAKEYQLIICLKGAHTAVVFSDGSVHFNNTGNAGMATGGTGDVLTGILTGLLAQGYPAPDAARLGVYCHGMAGDKGSLSKGQAGLIASDLIENLRVP